MGTRKSSSRHLLTFIAAEEQRPCCRRVLDNVAFPKRTCAGRARRLDRRRNLEPGIAPSGTLAARTDSGRVGSALQSHAGDAQETLKPAAVGGGLVGWWPVDLASDRVAATALCPNPAALLHDLVPARSSCPSSYTSSSSLPATA